LFQVADYLLFPTLLVWIFSPKAFPDLPMTYVSGRRCAVSPDLTIDTVLSMATFIFLLLSLWPLSADPLFERFLYRASAFVSRCPRSPIPAAPSCGTCFHPSWTVPVPLRPFFSSLGAEILFILGLLKSSRFSTPMPTPPKAHSFPACFVPAFSQGTVPKQVPPPPSPPYRVQSLQPFPPFFIQWILACRPFFFLSAMSTAHSPEFFYFSPAPPFPATSPSSFPVPP